MTPSTVPDPEPIGPLIRGFHDDLILAALDPDNDDRETPMPENPRPQLRPGRTPVDMSPEAIAARQKDAVKRMRESNAAWHRRRTEDRGELPFGEEDQ